MRELQVVNAAELAVAYASARYAVAVDGDALALRVGEPAADLEAYWPATRYVFLTAWNPHSEPHSEPANHDADARLVARLNAVGTARQAAWAEDASGDWREPGWLLADIDDDLARQLAREFGQAAVLAWERGQAVRLRMFAPGPSQTGAPAFIDWVE